jgi:hypothetical protein
MQVATYMHIGKCAGTSKPLLDRKDISSIKFFCYSKQLSFVGPNPKTSNTSLITSLQIE